MICTEVVSGLSVASDHFHTHPTIYGWSWHTTVCGTSAGVKHNI